MASKAYQGRRGARRCLRRHGLERAEPSRPGQRRRPGRGCRPRSIELGFVRNESARQLRAGRSRTIAYVVLDAANPFFTDVARGVEDVAEAARPRADPVQQRRGRRCASATTSTQLARAAGARHPDHPGRLRQRPAATRCPERGQSPWCSSTARPAGAGRWCTVASTTSSGGRPRGHPPDRPGSPADRLRRRAADRSCRWRDRLAGAPRARPAGRAARRAVLTRAGDRRAQRRRGPPGRASGSSACRPDAGPTAVFCANDLLALGLLQQLTQHGIAVPGDDRRSSATTTSSSPPAAAVPLTSVRQPRHQLGRAAAELLLDEADRPRPRAPARAVHARS